MWERFKIWLLMALDEKPSEPIIQPIEIHCTECLNVDYDHVIIEKKRSDIQLKSRVAMEAVRKKCSMCGKPVTIIGGSSV